MSEQRRTPKDRTPTADTIGRRTVLTQTLGAVVGGTILGGSAGLAAASGAEQSVSIPGIALPQGMRRIVTGHDASGRSYVVSDERVTGGTFPNLFQTTGDDPFGPGPETAPRELRPTDAEQLEPEVGAPASCS